MKGRDSHTGNGWKMYVDENVVVAEFTEAVAFDEVEQINETFLALTARDGVNATVACIDMEDAAGRKMLDGAQAAAKEAKDNGLEKWAIADDGIGKLAIKNRVDLPEYEVEAFDERTPAVDWAKE